MIKVADKVDASFDLKKQDVRLFSKERRKRYSLAELVVGVTPKTIKALNKKIKVFDNAKPVGRELI